jgi:hydroxyacylglutathione hydrolase
VIAAADIWYKESMSIDLKTIQLPLPYGLGSVNCYLIKAEKGFVLIDTGSSHQRASLEDKLEHAGCKPGNLKLIVITHGDFDHTGNAAYLRGKYDTKIAMHTDDAGMAERGDMFWNRKKGNPLFRILVPTLFRFKKSDRFTPDRSIGEGDDLVDYGLDAKVLSIPGHSKGSIGILTADGELFCGDLLANQEQPVLNAIMDNEAAANLSIEKLKAQNVKTVYPGHGKPFPWISFLENIS